MSSKNKIRLDQILMDKNLVETRSKAKALIMTGNVLVNEIPITKAGALVNDDDQLRIKEQLKYVSRGGLKLEKALQEFQINLKDKICLDIGASTGGFTDCLLQNGAKKVYAIDVGYGQLHWKLQTDDRVMRFDRENFRNFNLGKLTDSIDVIVMDVSFISIRKLIAKIIELFKRRGGVFPPNTGRENRAPTLITLIKPQFEVGPEHVGKGGIVRDDAIRKNTLNELKSYLEENGFKNLETTESPITGADGNVEYLVKCKWKT